MRPKRWSHLLIHSIAFSNSARSRQRNFDPYSAGDAFRGEGVQVGKRKRISDDPDPAMGKMNRDEANAGRSSNTSA
jgi:hypothetical protein